MIWSFLMGIPGGGPVSSTRASSDSSRSAVTSVKRTTRTNTIVSSRRSTEDPRALPNSIASRSSASCDAWRLTWQPIRYAHNGDVALAYTTGGGGDLDVLVIGGFVGHLEIAPTLPIAARFFDRLAEFSRVIAFDRRGMGL